MILQALLVASLCGQRSSSNSVPFDNPFWVEWLRGQRRSGPPSASLLAGANGEALQQKSSHLAFSGYSTETVPLLQPLFPRDNIDNLEKGKVFTPKIQTQLDSGYINEHESNGQLEVQQRLHRKVSSINGKSAIKTNSIQPNTFDLSATDAQSDISENTFSVKSINNEEPYLEESRSSSNLLPIDILHTNGVAWASNQNAPSHLSTSSFPENKKLDENIFVIANDDVRTNDAISYNLISSTYKSTVDPITTSASSLAPTTSTTTASTTTRTLVASWPAIRSRNIGSARAENRFRKRVPLSSSRKSGRRNNKSSRRRQNLKRRRQTITPQFRPTTSIPTTTILSTVPTITHNYDTTKTRVSRTPNLSTTTTTTTTTTVRITSTTTVTTTSSSTTLSTTTPTSTTTTTTQPTIAPTTSAATFVYTNLRTASALVVTRNVTSTRVVTAPIPEVTETEEETTLPTTTEMTSTEQEDFSTTTTTTLAPVQKDIIFDEEYIHENIENIPSSLPLKMTTHFEFDRTEQTTESEGTTDYENPEEEEQFVPLPSNINHVKIEDPGMRSPRLPKSDSDWEQPQTTTTVADIHSGAYHETNPGQYHEVNPGQYHEVNPGQPVALPAGHEVQAGQYHEKNPGQPVALAQKDGKDILSGQYHEVNPGQYHEVNPGQYHEKNPGQYVDDTLNNSDKSDHKVELVDVEHTDNAKIYNVQQRFDDFIIGEYGTITNSGQTLQGVRYTAVADDHSGVDPNLIYETLVKYFPMAAAKFAESNSRAAS